MKTNRRIGVRLASLALLGLLGGTASPALAASIDGGRIGGSETALLNTAAATYKCVFAKQRAAIRRLRAVNRCYQKPAELGTQDPDPKCLAAADARYRSDFMRIEAPGGCMPMTGDADSVADYVDECALGLFQVLPGSCLPAGSECGAIGYCCSPLMCIGSTQQRPTCR